MTWHDGVAYFMGGVFLANSVPHLFAGVSGRSFPTPFAKPPFRGPSPPAVNVLWGLFNLAVAWVLLEVVGELDPRRVAEIGVAATGFGLAAFGIARSVRRARGGTR